MGADHHAGNRDDCAPNQCCILFFVMISSPNTVISAGRPSLCSLLVSHDHILAMPKTNPKPKPASPGTSLDVKPYSVPSPISSASIPPNTTSDRTSPSTPTPRKTHTPRQRTNSPSKAWTAEELKQLFRFAIKHGAPGGDHAWEGVVMGRKGSACRQTWKWVVSPLEVIVPLAIWGQREGLV
jgi:hypothetical protein